MKKFVSVLAFALALSVIFGTLGCSNSSDESSSTQNENTQTTDGENTQSDENQTVVASPTPLTAENAEEILAAANGADWKKQETIIIPDGVTSIQKGIFVPLDSEGDPDDSQQNKTLKSVTIPNSVTKIDENAFILCIALESVEIPSSVTSIGNSTFSDCYALESVTIPNSVTSIGDNAFAYTSLTNVTIPGSVTSIGDKVFYKCSKLTSVTIQGSVTSIGNNAFHKCDSLASVTVEATTPQELGNDAFSNSYDDKSSSYDGNIYVPKGSVDTYKAADGWKNYADKIEAITTPIN